MDAAWRCLGRASFHDLTVDDICADAGVSKGSFYGYFESKQALLAALVDDEAAVLAAAAAEAAALDASGTERVRRYARAALSRADDIGRIQFRADVWSTLGTDPALEEQIRQVLTARRKLLRRMIEESIGRGEIALAERRANALASIVLALTEGLILHRALDPSAFLWTNVRPVIDALLEGIDATSPARSGRQSRGVSG